MPPCALDHVTTSDHVTCHHVATSDHVTSTTATSQEEESTSPACQPQDQQINPAIFTDDELEDQMFHDALDTVLPPSPVQLEPPATASDEVTSSPPQQYNAISATTPAPTEYKDGQDSGATKTLRYLSEFPRPRTRVRRHILPSDKILSLINQSPEQYLLLVQEYRHKLLSSIKD